MGQEIITISPYTVAKYPRAEVAYAMRRQMIHRAFGLGAGVAAGTPGRGVTFVSPARPALLEYIWQFVRKVRRTEPRTAVSFGPVVTGLAVQVGAEHGGVEG